MLKKRLPRLETALIALFFLSIPVTNFPFFPPSIGGNSAFVKPLLVYPLLALVLLITFPRLLTKPVPRPGVLLLVFFLWTLIASLIPFLRLAESPWREVSVLSREVRMLITLGLGLAIFYTVALYPRKEKHLEHSLRWLYGGLGLVLFWGSLQMIYVLDLVPNWYETMSKAQQFITSRKLNPYRVTGMTYEPSSFADQIITIWLPWVYAALLTDYSIFSWRWKWLTVEKLLFGWTFAVLASTLSRTGLIMGTGVLVFGLVLHVIRGRFSGTKETDTENPEEEPAAGQQENQRAWKITGLILLGLTVFLGMFFLFGSGSSYISRMWEYWFTGSGTNLRSYLIYIGFGSRITYWQTAFRIFARYPLFGVGLGNFTLYFPDLIPPQQLIKTPQVLRHLVPAAGRVRVITPKQFLARILAETGLVGGAIFVVFLITLAAGGLYLWLSDQEQEKFWGTGALLGLAGFAGATFSFDSFAIPNPWILFGMITGGFTVFLSNNSGRPSAAADAPGLSKE